MVSPENVTRSFWPLRECSRMVLVAKARSSSRSCLSSLWYDVGK